MAREKGRDTQSRNAWSWTDEKRASSWDYGTFRPPYSSHAHAQPSSGARCLIFGRTLRQLPYFMCANSEGSGKTARMRRLAWAFAGRLYDKYHNVMSWLNSYFQILPQPVAVWCYTILHFRDGENVKVNLVAISVALSDRRRRTRS